MKLCFLFLALATPAFAQGYRLNQFTTNTSAVPGLPGQYPRLESNGVMRATNFGAPVGYFTNGRTRLVFKGDSITLGYPGAGASSATNSWPSKLMSTYLTGNNWIISTNAGVVGQYLFNMQIDYTNDCKPFKPLGGTNAVLFLEGGINDISFVATATNLFTSWSNYAALAKSDGFLVFAMTLTPSLQLTSAQEFERNRYNDMLRLAAGQWDWLFDADLFMPPPPDYSTWLDYIHPNDGGYDNWAFGANETFKHGRGNRWPVGALYRTVKNFLGYARQSRNFPSSIYANADYPGIAFENRDLSRFWGAFLYTDQWLSYWHEGAGDYAGPDLISSVSATNHTWFRTLRVGTDVASTNIVLSTNGLITALRGTFYPTNTYIPSAALLGIGGCWIGNSNGSLVSIRSVDGIATVMKVLAP